MSEPEYELVYFDAAGRAEATRILLHAAGVKFTDTRIKFDDWPTMKAKTPLGFVPILKVDGKPYCQSSALVRFAAKKAGWYPKDDILAMAVDEVFETLNELSGKAPRVSSISQSYLHAATNWHELTDKLTILFSDRAKTPKNLLSFAKNLKLVPWRARPNI